MVQNKENIGTSWVEPFDLERLEMIADRVNNGLGTTGNFSDFECFVYSIMVYIHDHGKECAEQEHAPEPELTYAGLLELAELAKAPCSIHTLYKVANLSDAEHDVWFLMRNLVRFGQRNPK